MYVDERPRVSLWSVVVVEEVCEYKVEEEVNMIE